MINNTRVIRSKCNLVKARKTSNFASGQSHTELCAVPHINNQVFIHLNRTKTTVKAL